MPHLALFRKRERESVEGKLASVSLCDLTQALHFIGAATPLLWVYELAPLCAYFRCAGALPTLPGPSSCAQGL